jgi:hypothetical protein
MSEYPRYHTKEIAGRTLWWEDVADNGLEDFHLRLYYPDDHDRLRLVFINDTIGKNKYTLDAQTLRQEFGITHQDLGVQNIPRLEKNYTMTNSLDHLCTWPQKLYPNGPPRRSVPGASGGRLSPDIRAQIVPDRADAWI